MNPNVPILEAATGAKTLFYEPLGSNVAWGFVPPQGLPGVAISDKAGNQVVVNIDNLRTLCKWMDEHEKLRN